MPTQEAFALADGNRTQDICHIAPSCVVWVVVNPLTPKIWLLILSLSCYSFPELVLDWSR